MGAGDEARQPQGEHVVRRELFHHLQAGLSAADKAPAEPGVSQIELAVNHHQPRFGELVMANNSCPTTRQEPNIVDVDPAAL